MISIEKKKIIPVVFFSVLLVLVIFFTMTDIGTLFIATSLTLDATSSQGKASDRGVDASTGHFRGKGFKGNLPPRVCEGIGSCPVSTTDDIIDSRNGISAGGGRPSSTIGLSGLQVLVRDDVLVFDSFHTPAKGQEITGAILFEWGNADPIEVRQVLIPNEFFSWFTLDLPQTIIGEGIAFDGRSDGEFFYTFEIPENTLGTEFTIPVRIIVGNDIQNYDTNAFIEIETPKAVIDTFSFAEFFRSLFAFFRSDQ